MALRHCPTSGRKGGEGVPEVVDAGGRYFGRRLPVPSPNALNGAVRRCNDPNLPEAPPRGRGAHKCHMALGRSGHWGGSWVVDPPRCTGLGGANGLRPNVHLGLSPRAPALPRQDRVNDQADHRRCPGAGHRCDQLSRSAGGPPDRA